MIDDAVRGAVRKGVNSSREFLQARQRWQFSLRSLLVVVSMAAVTLGWSQFVGGSALGWLTIGPIAAPFLWVLAGAAIPARWHISQWLKLWVLVLGSNTVWGFYLHLSVAHAIDVKMLIEIIREGFHDEFWTAFALPMTLAFVPVYSNAHPSSAARRGGIRIPGELECHTDLLGHPLCARNRLGKVASGL